MKSEEEEEYFCSTGLKIPCHTWLHFSGLGSFTFEANHEQSCVEKKFNNVSIAEFLKENF